MKECNGTRYNACAIIIYTRHIKANQQYICDEIICRYACYNLAQPL